MTEDVVEKGHYSQTEQVGVNPVYHCTAGVVPLGKVHVGDGLFIQCTCCMVVWGIPCF